MDDTTKRPVDKILTGLVIVILFGAFSDLSLLIVVARLYFHYKRIEVDWSRTKDAADVVRNYVEAVAILGGAIWAFFKFRKGRTYQETLGLKISAKCLRISACNYLLITAQIKNIGASVVEVKNKGSGVSLWMYEPPLENANEITVEKIGVAAFPLVEQDSTSESELSLPDDAVLFSLEPNESIDFERLVTAPKEIEVGVRVKLSVASTGKYTWEATTIVRQIDDPGEKTNGGDRGNNQTQVGRLGLQEEANGP